MELNGWRLSGFLAWLLWCVAHIYFLIGLRNRFVVALNWLWSYLTFERGARLITGAEPELPTEPLRFDMPAERAERAAAGKRRSGS